MSNEQKITRALTSYKATIAHLDDAEQARRLARREKSLRAEQAPSVGIMPRRVTASRIVAR